MSWSPDTKDKFFAEKGPAESLSVIRRSSRKPRIPHRLQFDLKESQADHGENPSLFRQT
jgi:hypothetical protein